MNSGLSNWSGNYAYRAATVHRPRSVDELRELVAAAPSIRAVGSRHSFTAIGDATELVSLEQLGGEIEVDQAMGVVRAPSHLTYAELARSIAPAGLALGNLASLPHITIAGAIATATHGSGNHAGNLATAVVGLELVGSEGDLIVVRAGEPEFEGVVVGLGALGVVTTLTLRAEPHYLVSQRVFENLPWDALLAHIDEIMASGDSVSVFHRFGDVAEQIWVKRRTTTGAPHDEPNKLFGAAAATSAHHPLPGGDPATCTEQLGVAGPWSERVPHFRSEFKPGAGEEIQSELFVARTDALAALEAVRTVAHEIQPLLMISELRTIAPDRLWMSPHHGRDSIGLHFTWYRRQAEAERAVAIVEEALAPFGPRPHWGKLTATDAAGIERLYPRLDDFRSLRARMDPRGAFANDWLRRHVLGDR